MIKRLLFILLIAFSFSTKAQCPQVYNYLGVLSSNPYWLSCSGSTLYTLNFQSNTGWGPYTIIWGDGNPNQVAGSYVANSIISHTYTTLTPDTFEVTLLVPSLNCTLTGVVVMEKPVNATIQIPFGGVTQGCAPAILQFMNASTDVSETTHFQWNFGDGTPVVNYSYTNVGTTVTHTYAPGSVNCATSVTLKAWNYCSQGNTTIATYTPIQIYDKDVASIVPDKFIRCWPDNVFTFSNTTTRNCVAQGNTFQRQEWWNFGNHWGMPGDSIRNWSPWPPTMPVSIAYTATGTYTVMLRDSNLCGVNSAVISVAILNPPTAGVTAPAGPLCQNTAVTFTNSSSPGYSYMWNFGTGGGFVNLGAGPKTYTYTNPGQYTVQVAAYIAGGGSACTSTANVVINVLPTPTANFNNNPSYGCTTLNNVVFNDASIGAVSWNWGFGNGNTSTLQVPPNQNYISVGAYVVTLSIVGGNTCVNSKTATINVYPNPVANFSPTNTCASSVTNFTNTSTVTGTNAINSYTWNFGDGSPNLFTQNPSHTYTLPATYSVQLTVSTAFCSGSITQVVTVNPKPTASFVVSPTVGCSPLNTTFTNSSIGAVSYLWNFGTVPTSTSNVTNPSFTYTNGLFVNQSYTATLYAITAFGCVDSIKKTLTVLPMPVVSFTQNISAGCSPLPVTFTNNTLGATSYTWDFGDGNSSNSVNPSHTYTNNTLLQQTNTVQLIATNSVGCTYSSTLAMTVSPKPVFSLTMTPGSGCSPLSINFPSLLGAASYSWDFGDGSPLSNSSNPTHVFTNTTITNQTFTVTLTAANVFGCSNTTYAYPLVLTQPTASYNATPNSGCWPLVVSFTNSSTGNNSSSWNFNNGQTSLVTNPTHTFTNPPGSAATSYSVKLVVGSANNCLDSIVKIVNLFARPSSSFAIDTPACSPKLVTFTNSSIGASTYSWSFGNGNQSTQVTPSQTYINTGNSNQNYSVTLIAVNNNNCRDTSVVKFVLHPEAKFNIAASADSGCTPLTVFFPSIAGVQQYQWTYGDGNTANTGSVNNVFLNATPSDKTFTVQLIAKDQYGCVDTSKRTVKVFPKPVALFQVDLLTVFVPNQPVSFLNQSSGASSFSWNFGDGGKSTQNSPVYNYTTQGEYVVTLIASSNKGCKDTFSLQDKIIALDENFVQVPNAFTPNTHASPGNAFDPKDLSNDIFHPNIKGVSKYQMSVFSRWGELLYETKNPAEGWDGYYKGKICVADVYVWKIAATFVDGKKYDKAGDVLLLR